MLPQAPGSLSVYGQRLLFVKSEMIIFVIADFHCLEGISVVGMFQSQHQGAFSSLIGVVLESHLEETSTATLPESEKKQ